MMPSKVFLYIHVYMYFYIFFCIYILYIFIYFILYIYFIYFLYIYFVYIFLYFIFKFFNIYLYLYLNIYLKFSCQFCICTLYTPLVSVLYDLPREVAATLSSSLSFSEKHTGLQGPEGMSFLKASAWFEFTHKSFFSSIQESLYFCILSFSYQFRYCVSLKIIFFFWSQKERLHMNSRRLASLLSRGLCQWLSSDVQLLASPNVAG